MYTKCRGLQAAGADPNRTKPFYLCEYAHAMNNSMGSVGDYNDLFDKYPTLMGGAIWEWEDQGLWNGRDPNHQYMAYGGGFGDFPNDKYFIHKGVVFSDRSPKPHYPELKRAYQWVSFTCDRRGAWKDRHPQPVCVHEPQQVRAALDTKRGWRGNRSGHTSANRSGARREQRGDTADGDPVSQAWTRVFCPTLLCSWRSRRYGQRLVTKSPQSSLSCPARSAPGVIAAGRPQL